MSKGKIIAIVIVVVAMIIVIGSQVSKSDKMQGSSLNFAKIDKVRELSPEGAGGITYNQAYDEFFGSADWKHFVSDDNVDVVEFSGECSYNDKPGMIYIQFQLDKNDKIDKYYVQFNENGKEEKEDLKTTEIAAVLFKPFEEYAKNENKKPLTDEETQKLYSNYLRE